MAVYSDVEISQEFVHYVILIFFSLYETNKMGF